jgi:tRNA-specific 2-thiouridylase
MSKPGSKGYGIVLFSGGLDSMLAVALLRSQGLRIDALHFTSVFDQTAFSPEVLGLTPGSDLTLIDHTAEIIEAIKSPAHGLGKHLNPCIDCRIRMLIKAEAVRRARGADFIATGEVIGQRPMSQRKPSLDAVEKASGLSGRLLRPLSAGLLEPTEAEVAGLVDRSRLLSISGRGRKDQIRIAAMLGLSGYQNPAGGCALTNAEFAAKARDLLEHGILDPRTASSLRSGRHFRLDISTRVIIGRDEHDNECVAGSARPGDAVLETLTPPGPVTLVTSDGPSCDRHPPSRSAVDTACAWTAAYTKAGPDEFVEILVSECGNPAPAKTAKARPVSRDQVRAFRI